MVTIKDYLQEVNEKLKIILESQRKSSRYDEKGIQHFFEKYPNSLVATLEEVEASYSIYGGLVISQPRFKSLEKDRKPDFLIITSNSLNLYFNFIEIEDPSKLIFTSHEQKLSGNFTDVYHQLRKWDSFDNDEVSNYCRHLLDTLFKDNYDSRTHKMHHYNYILLYGFSDEVTQNGPRHNSILQNYFKERNFHHCTYSRLLDSKTYTRKLICVKKDQSEKYKAIGMTPFTQYQNDEWSDYHNVIGKEDLVYKSEYLTAEEKKKLIGRIQEMDKKTFKEITTDLLKSNINIFNKDDFEI